MLLIDQSTARELEKHLGQYSMQMDRLRRYITRKFGLSLREDKYPGCVIQQDLFALYQKELSPEARMAVDWCWTVDVTCRRVREMEDEKDTGRFSALLRLYYGFGLSAGWQKEWIEKPPVERRNTVMRSQFMEQTTFYQTRTDFLTALYMAAVQRGLYRPYPDELTETRRRHAVS